jgi:hypothetical protein
LVCANSATNTLTVLTNAGNALFIPSSTNTVGEWPFFVLAADVNNDGYPDLISANNFDGTVTILTNNGQGVFALASTPSVGLGSSPTSIAAVDFTGESRPDLIVADSGADNLTVLANQGNGRFAPFGALDVGGYPQSVAVVDVTGDGFVDVISANYYDNTLTVLDGGGKGLVRFDSLLSDTNSPFCLAVADVNGDGKPDVICADLGGTVTVWTNSGQVVLSRPALSASAAFQATLTGNAGSVYGVEGSTDLVHWTTLQFVALTNRASRFSARSALPICCYRAALVRAPVLASPAYARPTGFEASLLAAAGATNVVQVSSDLLNWTPLLTNVNTNVIWRFTNSTPGLSRRFYRVVTP